MDSHTYASDEELFDPDETCMANIQNTNSEEYDSDYYETRLVHRIQQCIGGVPPPPCLTTPKQTVVEIIERFNAAESVNNTTEEENVEKLPNLEGNNPASEITCSLDDVLSSAWPDIKRCRFYDIYYNRGAMSEKLTVLYEKYRERYVSCETCSFVTASNPPKPRDDQRSKNAVRSPRRKMSYLARRRTTFSSESLQAISSQAVARGMERKTIIMRTKRLFSSPRKSNLGEVSYKFSSSSLSHKLNRTPKKRTPSKRNTPRKKGGTPRKRTPRKQQTPKKRSMDKIMSNDKSVRSLAAVDSRYINNIKLTNIQQRKMLWAVYSSLKSRGIGMKHVNFQKYAQLLYKECKSLWNVATAIDRSAGTSDKMLKLARSHVDSVIDKVQTETEPIDAADISSQESNFDSDTINQS